MHAPRRGQGPPRRARRGQPRLHAGLPGRPRGAAAGAHRLRRRAAVQGRDDVAARRASLARTMDGYGNSPAELARGVGFTTDQAGLAGHDGPRARPPQARTRAGRGLPHRLRGRLRRPPRRRGGRHRDHRGPRGRARHARRPAAAVPRHPHQVDGRGVEGAQRAHARDLPRHAARRDRRPAARQLRRHAAQGHRRRAAADAGAAVRDPRAPPRPGRGHAAHARS